MRWHNKGFTLVELLIVMTILAMAAIAMIGILNPTQMTNRAWDTRRKKDLRTLKLAFEEYFNDRGCYPKQTTIDILTCNSTNFVPWLSHWPCEPGIELPYKIFMENNVCPRSFRILTNLTYRKDKDIPEGWYSQPDSKTFGDGTLNKNDVNFGVSSSNINWYE